MIKFMILLWQAGLVDSFTLIQFLQNAVTQYGATAIASAAASSVPSMVEPSMLIQPLITTVSTGVSFLSCVKDAPEFRQRVATVAVFACSSAVATTTDIPINAAVGGVNAAFLAYMQACIDAANNSNIPFMLPYKVGQGKVFILVVITGGVLLIIYYYIKLLIRASRKGYRIGKSEQFRNKVSNFVHLTHQILATNIS